MPTAGLSLFGFYPLEVATQYLAQACHVADPSPNAINATWVAARDRLGAPPANPGKPSVLELPADCAEHLAQLSAHPLMARFQADFGEWSVGLVEIGPVVAAQAQVERNRCSGMHDLGGAAPLQLLERCLPIQDQGTQVIWEQDQNGRGLLIRHADHNLQAIGGTGTLTPEGALVVGPVIGQRAAWVHVIDIDGRLYLRNGYHRAVGLMEAGHSHMPCLLLKGSRAQLGVNNFPLDILYAENPPTLGHFAVDLATEVQLRKATKMIAISWTEFLVPEKD
jgi:hypothetical protein